MVNTVRIVFSKEEREEFERVALDRLKQGISGNKIAEEIGISTGYFPELKKRLIEQGKITEKEIEEARNARKKKELAEARRQNPNRLKVLEGLRKGLNDKEIAENLPFKPYRVYIIAKELIEEGLITREEINQKRNQRTQEIEKEGQQEIITEVDDKLTGRVLAELKKGTDGKKISRKLNLGKGIFAKIRRKLINQGMITIEEIKKAEERRLKRDKKFIYDLLKQGYTQDEITEKMKDETFSYVKGIVKDLKDEGTITDEEIQEARFEKNQRELFEFVIIKLKEGCTNQEIADRYEQEYGKNVTGHTISMYKKRAIQER